MNSQELQIISCVFLNFKLLNSYTRAKIDNNEGCSESRCGRANGYLSIRFPFRVANIQSQSCAYPGFDLYCDSSNKTILNIPNSGNFSVQGIDYIRQEIVISDPDECLAKRFLSGLDLSNTPFSSSDLDRVSFYNCSKNNENYTNDQVNWDQQTIGCLSTVPDYAVVGVDPVIFGYLLDSWCDLIGYVMAPPDLLKKVMNANVALSWTKPACDVCEANVKRCGFANNGTALATTCIPYYDTPIARKDLRRTRYAKLRRTRYVVGFSVGLGVPAVAILAVILWKFVRSRRSSAEIDRGSSVEIASPG